MTPIWVWAALTLLALPLLVALVDFIASIRAKLTPGRVLSGALCDDFRVLVPIYGDVRYLQNVRYLARYGSRVTLCTTTSESAEFYSALTDIARQHGFLVFRCDCSSQVAPTGAKQTGGTTRDRVIRDALRLVKETYVVCIDADTVTERSLDELIGTIVEGNYDVVSIQLRPANADENWLTRVQAHEYRVAMSLRKIGPWLLSGACHGGRTVAMDSVMTRHSLFFQGNDVETGLIAHGLGMRVGHVPFVVPTDVPAKLHDWWRQRYAWSGGEFRLFVVNAGLIVKHPWLWIYGMVVMYSGAAFRWAAVLTAPHALVVVFFLQLPLLLYVNWKTRDRWLLLVPIYAAFNSLVLVPLAAVSYLRMAMKSRNAGLITMRPRPAPSEGRE